MKCLAVGMNPNYVLSEEERKKRFRKKNNSGNLADIGEDKFEYLKASENKISSGISFNQIDEKYYCKIKPS